MSHREIVPMDQMGQWVQDALDAIEYANGPTHTFWGGLRAKHGHPAPFNMRYLEIGNENGGQAYRERWALFVKTNDEEDRVWWNIAGWNNTQHAVELDATVDPKRGSVETGRWCDIRVQVAGPSVKCWLDGKLVHDLKNPRATTSGIFASAARDNESGELILKVVNAAATPTETAINLNGVNKLAAAQAIVLTSSDPKDENSLEQPTKVSPKTETLSVSGPEFRHTFPGNSLTVLRVKTGR